MRIRWLTAVGLVTIAMTAPATAVTFLDWWTMAVAKIALLGEPAVAGTEVSAIEVDARDGLVTLRGQVATDDAREAARVVTRRIAGVRAVKNELRIDARDTPLTARPSDGLLRSRVTRALRRDSRLAGASIQVSVEGGIVRLTGVVPVAWDRVRASEVAHAVIGIIAVQNEIGPRTVALELRR